MKSNCKVKLYTQSRAGQKGSNRLRAVHWLNGSKICLEQAVFSIGAEAVTTVKAPELIVKPAA